MWCYVYVDGEYVRSELRSAGQPEEFDPRKPASFVGNHWIGGERLVPFRVFYYDAADSRATQEDQARQQKYYDRIRGLPDTHVILGEVRRTSKKREQKGVDVNLAVDALRVAMSGVVRSVALVSGDGDFAPMVKAIREAYCHVVVLAFPSSLSKSLADEADRVHLWESTPTDWTLD